MGIITGLCHHSANRGDKNNKAQTLITVRITLRTSEEVMICLEVSSSAVAKCLMSAFWIKPFLASSIKVVMDKKSDHIPYSSLVSVLTRIKKEPKPSNRTESRSAMVKRPELIQYFLFCN